MGSSTTLTEGSEAVAGGGRSCAYLFKLLDAEQPLEKPERYPLDDADLVTLGRGDAVSATPSRAQDVRTLALTLPDRRMSTSHAKLTHVLRAWVLEDAGSKNGVLLNGEPCSRAELQDGDLVELGRTFFLFRDALPLLGPAALTGPFATLSPALELAFAQLARIAASQVTVALGGPSGSGKEVVARAIHALSGRKGPFVAVNCGALPPNLVESELFGHKKGAFSGATEDRAGYVRSASGGTLFLDEIGDLPLNAQPALLRVLQEKQVQPIGAGAPVPVDLRVVSATHCDLDEAVADEDFRADLHARLSGHSLTLPALADRREDLGLIIAALLSRLAGNAAQRVKLTPRAARALLLYGWPMNVRELEKALEAALVLAGGAPIDLDHLPEALRTVTGRPRRDAAVAHDEASRKAWLEGLLREHGGNISAVARAAGKARNQIHRWMARYGLSSDGFKRL